MFLFTWIITCLRKTFRRALKAILLAGYNDYTIYRYFRKRGARIGDDCIICVSSLGTPWLVSLGNHVWISKDVVFHSHDGGTWVLREKHLALDIQGPIIIEDNCLIGKNVQLLPNIRIGRNSIVGAGSVVISDIPPNSIVMGIPARPVSSLSKYEERCLALWKEQIPPGVDKSVKNWWALKGNVKIIRRNLIDLYMNQAKEEKENVDK